MVSQILMPDQKANWNWICADILEHTKADRNVLENFITCDEIWIFQYDLEMKWQSMDWKTSTSQRLKKACQRSPNSRQIIVSFRSRVCFRKGGMHSERCCSEPALLQTSSYNVERTRSMLWVNGFILHQDNTSLSTCLLYTSRCV